MILQTKRAKQDGNPYLALTPLPDSNQIWKLNHVTQF
jgi:hypothetical protein